MRLAILPARENSKRLPHKNIRDFCGAPMISYPLRAARESGLFAEIHVSTDGHKVRNVVEQLGFPVPFLRSADLADDHTGVVPVVRQVLSDFRDRGQNFDAVCMIYPCSPMLEASDLVAGFQLFDSHKGQYSVMTTAPYPAPVEWAMRIGKDGLLEPMQPGMDQIRSQDMEPAYYETASFIIFSAHKLLADDMGSNQYLPYLMPAHRAIDIDDEEDWAHAEAVFRGVHAVRN